MVVDDTGRPPAPLVDRLALFAVALLGIPELLARLWTVCLVVEPLVGQ